MSINKKTLRVDISKEMKERMRVLSLKPSDLARYSGVSKQVISLWLKGTSPKNMSQVKAVANVLGCTMDFLLNGEKTHNADKKEIVDAKLNDFSNYRGYCLFMIEILEKLKTNENHKYISYVKKNFISFDDSMKDKFNLMKDLDFVKENKIIINKNLPI